MVLRHVARNKAGRSGMRASSTANAWWRSARKWRANLHPHVERMMARFYPDHHAAQRAA